MTDKVEWLAVPSLVDIVAMVEVLGYEPCAQCGGAPDDWARHCGHTVVIGGCTGEHENSHRYRRYMVADIIGKGVEK